MSQSDQIRYKKTSNQLKEVNKLDAVLNSQDYISYKQYTLESNIANTKPVLNQLTLAGKTILFGMEKKVSKCPINNFVMCNKTNQRPNRVLLAIDLSGNMAPKVNQQPEKQIV